MINGIALASTIFIEAIVVAFLAPFAHIKKLHLVILSMIVNVITQPSFTIWLKYITYGQDYKWPYYFLVGEVTVIAIEALFYFLALRQRNVRFVVCALFSIIANVISLSIGLLLPL